ncbi:MAG: glycosyltransferase family 4 protein [Isosphaeraceae bacterium]|nr:glycosyltransferase family 4 protein [Isosphaeraceae bacterium]
MRIAQVAPLYERVPPKWYGGTERVVSYLTEELVRQGHDVTLFASGDSVTSARLVAPCRQALRLDHSCIDPLAHHILMLDQVRRVADEFDILHFHIDYLHFPLSRCERWPHITTLHGRLDLPDLIPLYEEFREMPLVSISDAQRAPLPWVRWCGTVHHGLPEDLYSFHEGPGQYLAFLGRVSPEKRVDRAIEIAQRLDLPLKIAAKVDKVDREYFEAVVRPRLDDPRVEFIGEIGEDQKNEFLGNALAVLFPIDWPEPFGMVMIEAMACGTPVVAYRNGSVPEVMEDGVTGFIVSSIEEAVEATRRVEQLSRRRVREVFERRFTATRMARDYLAVYETILESRGPIRSDTVTLPDLAGASWTDGPTRSWPNLRARC